MNKKFVVSILIVMSLLIGISIFSVATAEYSPTPTPTLTPSPSPTPTPSLSEMIAEELEKRSTGQMVFNAPENMTIGKKERIEVRITRNNTAENLTEGLKGRGVPNVEKIKVGISMDVRLEGKNFEIERLFIYDKQPVGSEEFREWTWDVTPLALGVQELHLKSAVATPRYDKWGSNKQVRDVPIYVKLGGIDGIWYLVKSFLKKHWQWIVGTLIAIITIIIHVVLVRRSEKSSS